MTITRSTIVYASNGSSYNTVPSIPGEILIDRQAKRLVSEDGNGGWILHANKSDITALTQSLSAKADASVVTQALSGKVDIASLPAAVTAATGTMLNAKADRYPTSPFSSITAGTADLSAGFQSRWFDSSNNNRLFPAYYLGEGVKAGLKNTASGAVYEPWILAQGVTTQYEMWKERLNANDAAGAATIASSIASTADFLIATFNDSVISSTTYGVNKMTGLSDDSAWVANMFRMFHEVTGNNVWLTRIANVIAASLQIYRQYNNNDNPVIDTGALAPSGVPIKYNPLGMLYSIPGDRNIGLLSSGYEPWMAYAAWYCAQDKTGTLTTAQKNAFRAYTLAIYAWTTTSGRGLMNPAPSNPTRGAQYLIAAGFNLDPNVGTPSGVKQPYNSGETYLTTEGSYFGAPIRSLSREYDAGTCATIALALYINSVEPDPAKVQMAKNIAAAIPLPNGFGRTDNGVPYIQCVREPWTGGHCYPIAIRWLLTLGTTSGLLPLFQALYNSARYIINTAGRGFAGPDWFPQERNFIDDTYSWEESNAVGYGGSPGGSMGRRDQLMTHASCVNIVLSAKLLVGLENVLSSGVTQQMSIEQAIAEFAAGKAASKRTAPSIVYISDTVFLLWNGNKSILTLFKQNVEVQYWNAGGSYIYGGLSAQAGIQAGGRISFGRDRSADWYLDQNGSGDAFVSLGSGVGITGVKSNNRNELWLNQNGATRLLLNQGGAALYGSLTLSGYYGFSSDNTWSFGLPNGRASNIYCATSTISTSDKRTKKWIGALSSDELTAFKDIERSIGKYQFIDAIVEKGAKSLNIWGDADVIASRYDEVLAAGELLARWHCGVLAQDIADILTHHGLDPMRYAFLCYDIWDAEPAITEQSAIPARPAILAKDGSVITPEVPAVPNVPGREALASGDRWGIRYSVLEMYLRAASSQRETIKDQLIETLVQRVTLLETSYGSEHLR